MNIVSSGQDGILAFNVFTVRAERQQALVDLIVSAGDPSDIPGLRSMQILRSLDGTQVINCMHWESVAALKTATRTDPRILGAMRRVGELIESAQPNHYEIAAVLK
ncbi:antibiotic biosynthesis monooxygenase family protein [Nocardia sp. alder85J]|uniref:antibiotic biosynthesis monooxygenase family protein n=1 Tax=Nocardia sp. alder85J TaxID=2862949 RepID=UPI001CD31BB6|nr:antibiotic biosynthesis monooxygenase [Nocardia sp. alder85J]MCX4093976.1 antibiotic biosynthesis monooxygenase [Nocardia sp. alder85J]